MPLNSQDSLSKQLFSLLDRPAANEHNIQDFLSQMSDDIYNFSTRTDFLNEKIYNKNQIKTKSINPKYQTEILQEMYEKWSDILVKLIDLKEQYSTEPQDLNNFSSSSIITDLKKTIGQLYKGIALYPVSSELSKSLYALKETIRINPNLTNE